MSFTSFKLKANSGLDHVAISKRLNQKMKYFQDYDASVVMMRIMPEMI